MRKLKKKTYFIIFLLISFFLTLFVSLNKDYYKNLILEKVYNSIEHKIAFNSSEFNFFPSPGIQFYDIKIQSNKSDFSLNSKSIALFFSWKILFGNIILKSVLTSNIELIIDNSKKNNSELGFNKSTIKLINSFIKIEELVATDLKITFLGIEKKEYQFKKILANHDNQNEIELKLDYISENGNFNFETNIIYEKDNYDFEKLDFKIKILFNKFNLILFKEYYKVVREARFDNSTLNGEIILTKKKDSNDIIVKLNNIDLEKLKYIKTNYYPTINLNSTLVFKVKNEEVLIQDLFVSIPSVGFAKATGNVQFKDIIKLNLFINGEYANVFKIIEIVSYSTDLTITNGKDFTSNMKILVKKVQFENYDLTDLDLDLNIYNSKIGISLKNANILNGKIVLKGEIIASNNTKYDFESLVFNIRVEDLIQKYTFDKFLKGNLISNFKFNSNGNTIETFRENLKANGKVEIKNGELLGYANFLKPIFSLGKLVNFLGPKGKNSGFQSLITNFKISNQLIETQNLKMVGVGLDANGSGKISFNRKVDYKIKVGLGGMAGKVFFIPILYKGTMPDNVSYIDPVWLGSVYLGTTFLAGPIGTTVGGIAGSTVSEYVRSSYESVKNFFGFGKKNEDE